MNSNLPICESYREITVVDLKKVIELRMCQVYGVCKNERNRI